MGNPLHEHFAREWPAVAPAWVRWGDKVEVQSRAATAFLLEMADVPRGARVLDLASGVGDPALALAEAVGPDGEVVATDLIDGTLEMLRGAARARGLANVVTHATAMEELPFDDASFDRVTCRLGLMFATDLAAVLAHVRRVLRPGGRAAFLAWGPPDQPLFRALLGPLPEGMAAAIGAPDRPGPFRFAVPGTFTGALAAAGLQELREETRTLPWPWPGPPSEMWEAFRDLSGPAMQESVDAAADLAAFERGGVTDPTAIVVGATAVR